MKTTIHPISTLAGTRSRAAIPHSHPALPAVRPAGLRAAFTAIIAALLLLAAMQGSVRGEIVAWGYNNSGQTTVPAGAHSGVTAIAGGDVHTVALKSDGSVDAWGRNDDGQTTVPAGALSGVTAIAAGGRHTVALNAEPATTVIFKGATAGATPSPGDAVPGEPAGTTFVKFGVPAINGAGAAAFLTDIKAGTVTVTAIFGGSGIVARKGDIVGGFTLSALKDPVFNDDDAIASLVTLTGAVTSATNKAILFVPDGGPAALIARLGGEPAGVTGAQWKTFKSVALPDSLGPVFTAQMLAGAGGVTTADDLGLWALDGVGVLRLIVREGVTVIDGKTVKSFAVLSAVSGSPGQTRAFNSAGELLYRVTFTDDSQAVMMTAMP